MNDVIDYERDVLHIEQAAELLGVSVRTTQRYIASGKLASFKHAGKTMVHREAISDYFRSLINQAEVARARAGKRNRAG
jgi:excisionase family DNA binding protein